MNSNSSVEEDVEVVGGGDVGTTAAVSKKSRKRINEICQSSWANKSRLRNREKTKRFSHQYDPDLPIGVVPTAEVIAEEDEDRANLFGSSAENSVNSVTDNERNERSESGNSFSDKEPIPRKSVEEGEGDIATAPTKNSTIPHSNSSSPVQEDAAMEDQQVPEIGAVTDSACKVPPTSSRSSTKFPKERKILHSRYNLRRKPIIDIVNDECLLGVINKPVVDVFIPEQPGRCLTDECIAEQLRSRLSCYAHSEKGTEWSQNGKASIEDPNVEYNVRLLPMLGDPGKTTPQEEDEIETDVEENKAMEVDPPKVSFDDDSNEPPSKEPPSLSPPKYNTRYHFKARKGMTTKADPTPLPVVRCPDWQNFQRPPLAPELTADMIAVNDRALAKNEDETIVEVEPSKKKVIQKDLAGYYEDDKYLSDPVVDFYMELIYLRSLRHEDYPKLYVFRSTFYTLLAGKNGLKNTEETTDKVNIFQYDMAFFPVCVSSHWRLGVAFFRQNRLKIYNSKKSRDLRIFKKIQTYLQKEYERMIAATDGVVPNGLIQPDDWTLEVNTDNVPQQGNNFDCGVFVLQYAEHLARRRDFDFSQEHMAYFRERMIYETVTSQLLT